MSTFMLKLLTWPPTLNLYLYMHFRYVVIARVLQLLLRLTILKNQEVNDMIAKAAIYTQYDMHNRYRVHQQ